MLRAIFGRIDAKHVAILYGGRLGILIDFYDGDGHHMRATYVVPVASFAGVSHAAQKTSSERKQAQGSARDDDGAAPKHEFEDCKLWERHETAGAGVDIRYGPLHLRVAAHAARASHDVRADQIRRLQRAAEGPAERGGQSTPRGATVGRRKGGGRQHAVGGKKK